MGELESIEDAFETVEQEMTEYIQTLHTQLSTTVETKPIIQSTYRSEAKYGFTAIVNGAEIIIEVQLLHSRLFNSAQDGYSFRAVAKRAGDELILEKQLPKVVQIEPRWTTDADELEHQLEKLPLLDQENII